MKWLLHIFKGSRIEDSNSYNFTYNISQVLNFEFFILNVRFSCQA